MATQRPDPYSGFNFLVQLGTSSTVNAGFQEVSGMHIEVTSAEYRVGNSVSNHPVKVNGVYKVGDVTLKRGLIGAADLYQMTDSIRTGDQTVIQNVQVQLQDEAHNKVFSFTLVNARPIRWTAPTLNAKGGTEVAIEELVLSCEDLSVD
ncbi:MAG: phage tail protein [Streptosporangiaceae bacterium]|jgi:phage tail-like protein